MQEYKTLLESKIVVFLLVVLGIHLLVNIVFALGPTILHSFIGANRNIEFHEDIDGFILTEKSWFFGDKKVFKFELRKSPYIDDYRVWQYRLMSKNEKVINPNSTEGSWRELIYETPEGAEPIDELQFRIMW